MAFCALVIWAFDWCSGRSVTGLPPVYAGFWVRGPDTDPPARYWTVVSSS